MKKYWLYQQTLDACALVLSNTSQYRSASRVVAPIKGIR
jgi:hypothetical protein